MRRLWLTWHFFKSRAINRNFKEPIRVIDPQGRTHYVATRRELWRVAWDGYRPQ